jgi:acetyl-CoA synthetase (ADP-forming)
VAVLGASDDRAKFGGRIMHNLIDHGFGGDVLPINPNRTSVLDRACFPRVQDAGGEIDVAIVAVPPAAVPAAVRDCADIGVASCVIVTTGFAEQDAHGLALQNELVATAHGAGMRVLGPNCMGYMNQRDRVAMSSAKALGTLQLVPGSVALVTQSGGLMTSMFAWAVSEGIGLSFCASTGNESDVDLSDLLAYVSERSDFRTVCVYAERIGRPAQFLDAARHCAEAGIGVVLLKSGRTTAGAQAAMSHTASIVGSFEVIAANCESAGIVLVDDPKAMLRAAALSAMYRPDRVRKSSLRSNVGVISGSGGALTIAADRVAEAGLPIASLSNARPKAVGEAAGIGAGPALFDTGRRALGVDEFTATTSLISYLNRRADIGGIIVIVTGGAGDEETVDAIVQSAADAAVPTLCGAIIGGVTPELADRIRATGLPLFDTIDEVLRVMTAWLALQSSHGRALPADRPASLRSLPGRRRTLTQLLAAGSTDAFSQATLKELLRSWRLPANQALAARTEAEALAKAKLVGYPVVLKIASSGLAHKQSVGGVVVGVGGPKELRAAWRGMVGRVQALRYDVAGCTVEPMVGGDLELLLGIRWDGDWPGIVVIGDGGVSGDTQREHRELSAGAAQQTDVVLAALRSLRRWERAFHGVDVHTELRSARSVAGIARKLGRLGQQLAGLHPGALVLELNPVTVDIATGTAAILDVHAVSSEHS